ncbi:hypothetical protein L1987_74720 [Smallanthus sonchifolius]|uniref:Uncharacterized protein n=1 Tax=Smallanthus sonchifolius TaxID=185202 RepID=A0ACB9A4D2_9ASTR|nr:hypothetical protein L1987_74720 [Smallanthus sonchifolius]
MVEEPSPEQIKKIHKLNLFKIKGRDKRGHKILRIMGKHFPAKSLTVDLLKKYLEVKIFPKLERPFVVVYIHTDVHKSENFPGISVYDAIPITVKQNMEAVYFSAMHGLYAKQRYVSRLAYLWEHVKRNEIEIPEFVYDHDEDLEYRPMIGLRFRE